MSARDREKWDRRYREGAYAQRTHPSALLADWIDRIPPGRALDVACGAGRNALYLAGKGFAVDAVDISGEALRRARDSARRVGACVNWLRRDLDDAPAFENGYQLILVIRYVDLPLIRRLASHLAPGGFLVCEEHLQTAAEVVGPRSPEFRVPPGALRAAAAGLRVHCVREGPVAEPDGQTAALARLVAQRVA